MMIHYYRTDCGAFKVHVHANYPFPLCAQRLIIENQNNEEPKQEQHSCTKQLTTQLMSMRNTFSHHQTTEPEIMQPTENCIQMLMYIDILSSRVPSSPGTPYHQLYVKSTPLTSSRQDQGPSSYQCYPRCKYVHFVFNCIYDLLLALQKGHVRRVNTQYRVQSFLF